MRFGIVSQNMRQLKMQNKARRLTSRSAVRSLDRSAWQPDFRILWKTSIFLRHAYHSSFSMASAREWIGRLVMSLHAIGSRPRGFPRSTAWSTVRASAGVRRPLSAGGKISILRQVSSRTTSDTRGYDPAPRSGVARSQALLPFPLSPLCRHPPARRSTQVRNKNRAPVSCALQKSSEMSLSRSPIGTQRAESPNWAVDCSRFLSQRMLSFSSIGTRVGLIFFFRAFVPLNVFRDQNVIAASPGGQALRCHNEPRMHEDTARRGVPWSSVIERRRPYRRASCRAPRYRPVDRKIPWCRAVPGAARRSPLHDQQSPGNVLPGYRPR